MMLRLALMLVVFVDLMGQGLIFPIIPTLIIDPSSDFLPSDTSENTRNLLYGLVTGIFYLFWFFGAAYISKLSDYIGRKSGMVICLVGALAGYVLTVIAIESSSYWLLLLARCISGFTAGNQPIAQAALIDISRDDEERSQNMGRIVAASALGLVTGPIIAGLLSDPQVLGPYATLELPFIVAAGLIVVTLVLVLSFYHDATETRRKIDFGVEEVFLNLWRLRGRATIIKLSFVWFFFELGLNAFVVYLDDYTIEMYKFGTLQNSILFILVGLALAVSSGVLAGRLSKRFGKIPVVAGSLVLMAVAQLAFLLNDVAWLSYVIVVPVVLGFGLGYPTMLSLFSASAGKQEQGWVMGITIALFTLGTGIIAVVGGALMEIDPHLPFIVGVAAYVLALIFVATLWRGADVKALDSGQMHSDSKPG